MLCHCYIMCMMYVMQRTQVLLEDWQYEALKAQAERQGRSMSDVLRGMLDSFLDKDGEQRPALTDIRGIGSDRETSGRDHDETLYEKRTRRR